MKKIILDLCGGTGSWSRPYKEAGYDVRVITLPEYDVRQWMYNNRLNELDLANIYGILAAPPCTHFSVSGAQYWKAKDADGRTFEDTTILTACLMIIARTKPKFWVIENPVGRMKKMLGQPDHIFNPCDYGDAYTKKTYLWGQFNIPKKNPVEPVFIRDSVRGRKYSPIHWYKKDAAIRSITPPPPDLHKHFLKQTNEKLN